MKKLTQTGGMDLHIVIIALVVILAGGLTVFRISTTNENRGNVGQAEGDEIITDADANAESEETADSVEQGDQQDETDTPNSSDQPSNTSSQPSNTTEANFIKGGVGPPAGSNMFVDVSVSMDGAHTGTCTYTFTLGNTTVVQTDSITNSKVCDIDVPVEFFPKNGTYAVGVAFESNDGSVTASVGGFSVDVTPAQFNFTKGGGSFDGTNVVISETSALGHTGTCDYIFTKGSQRVERSNNITNSRTCAINIPGTDFPSLGDWNYTLTFTGTTEYVVGSGGGFVISIN